MTCWKSFYFMVMVMFHPAMVRLSPFQVQHRPDHIDSNASKKECTYPMTMENQQFEDVFSMKMGIFHCHVSSGGCNSIGVHETLLFQP